ncbi:DSD1 family PLP-dependent enzyme [Alteromonadaceae bacterium M269]|nr:DSD1 family PLP-dependent enzyme [Alteromonadaceae bacterium M269]
MHSHVLIEVFTTEIAVHKIDIALAQLDTPFLYVDKPQFLRNIRRMKEKIEGHKVELRTHFKTLKSLEGAPYLYQDKASPITVSTLKEAEALAEDGYKNLTYAVGIAPQKLPRVKSLISKGTNLSILLDSMSQAAAVSSFCKDNNCDIPVWIEIDCDNHRAGIKPESSDLLEVANILYKGDVTIRGVLTHAGGSYACSTPDQLLKAANEEKNSVIFAASRLKDAGIPCPYTSIGSTPTALSYADLTGITEVRAGVFPFFDLVMAGIGVCEISEIALSVVTTVIGYNAEKNWLLIDAGWMALSRDRGTSSQQRDCGYGLVCDFDGHVIDSLYVDGANQEHGIIVSTDGYDMSSIKVGTKLRILPNHACATAGMHLNYQVIDKDSDSHEVWNRILGW